MEKKYEDKYHVLEEKHWWFLARRNILEALLYKLQKSSKILEVGCGGGSLLKELQQKGYKNAGGLDISKKAVAVCKKRGVKNVKVADAVATGYSAGSMDAVIASDVLEHIENEEKALKEWNRILKKGGKLLLFSPAFNFLWSEHDLANKHYRRYEAGNLAKLLKKNGFEVERLGYWNFLLFLPISAMRLLQKAAGIDEKPESENRKDQLKQQNSIANGFLLQLMKLENSIILSGLDFPFGVSVFAIAKKK